MLMTRYVPALLSLSLISGCAFGPGMKFEDAPYRVVAEATTTDQNSSGEAFTITPITPTLLTAMRNEQSRAIADNGAKDVVANRNLSFSNYEYRVGPQDVLTVIVWDHPELTIPAGEFRATQDAGTLVDSDGTIFFPYVGVMKVAGMTVGEIRELLTTRIAQYVTKPQIGVRVAAFRSQRVNVLGTVLKPSALPITDVPLTALDAINQAGGVTPESDLGRVTLTRGSDVRTLDLQSLYENGAVSQNVVLQHNDVLQVPDRGDNMVYVLGEVGKPSSYLMRKGRMNLAEAIGGSAGFDATSSDPSRLYVIRGEQNQPVVYQLNAESPDALLLATQFQLKPQDVIYVSSTSLTRWNRVMTQILPTIQGLWQTKVLLNK